MTDTLLEQPVHQSTSKTNPEKFFLDSNELAVKYLLQKQYDECLGILKRMEYALSIENVSSPPGKLTKAQRLGYLSILYNNLGCSLVGRYKITEGIQYFKKCQETEEALIGEDLFKAITNLNMAIVSFKQKNYNKSLGYWQTAQSLIEMSLFGNKRKEKTGSNSKSLSFKKCLKVLLSDDTDLMGYDENTIVSICLYYTGLNQEMLEMSQESYMIYKKGLEFLYKTHHSNIPLLHKLQDKVQMLQPRVLSEKQPTAFEFTAKKISPKLKQTARIAEVSTRGMRETMNEEVRGAFLRDSQGFKDSKGFTTRTNFGPMSLTNQNFEMPTKVGFVRSPLFSLTKNAANYPRILLPSLNSEKGRNPSHQQVKAIRSRRTNISQDNPFSGSIMDYSEDNNSATVWNNNSNLVAYQPMSAKKSKQLSFDLSSKRNKIKFRPSNLSNIPTDILRNTVLTGRNPWVSEPKSASQRIEMAVHQSLVMKKSAFAEQNDNMEIKRDEGIKIKEASHLANKLKDRAVDILDKLNNFKTLNDEAMAILNSMEDERFETC